MRGHLPLLDRDLSRRGFLRQMMLGFGVLSLPDILRMQAEAGPTTPARKTSLILLWQDGGPSHFESFDPKPEASSDYRGELDAISTTLPGVQFCEVLPRLAQMAHRFNIIRSLHQPSSGHVDGSHNVLTGWDGGTLGSKSKYPDLATIIHRMRGDESEDSGLKIGSSTDARLAKGMRNTSGNRKADSAGGQLPGYISLAGGIHRGGPAYLGPVYAPFQIAGDPSKPNFQVQNMQVADAAERFLLRRNIYQKLDRLADGDELRRELDISGQIDALDRFHQQAFDLLSGSGAASRAFDLSREKPAMRERYGFHTAGQQTLLARRLVEAGVGVVAIRFCPDGRGDYEKGMIGWDDHAVHGNIFEITKKRGPQFDQAVSTLIDDLEERGLDEQTLVVVMGEFGRTPRVNTHKGCPGRDHWGPAGNALVYGGGLNRGQVIGSTNRNGERPQDRPLKTQDLLATIYHCLGIDQNHRIQNLSGLPVPILPTGKPIEELVG